MAHFRFFSLIITNPLITEEIIFEIEKNSKIMTTVHHNLTIIYIDKLIILLVTQQSLITKNLYHN